MSAFAVGDKLWMVPSQRYMGDAREVTVTKVGRKWLTLDNGYRASAADMWLDGGGYTSPGSCYASRAAWEAHKELCDAWEQLRRDVDRERRPPPGVTAQLIWHARASLGLANK